MHSVFGGTNLGALMDSSRCFFLCGRLGMLHSESGIKLQLPIVIKNMIS